MKLTQLKEIIKNEDPCLRGYRWFLEESKGCKTAVSFFRRCKRANYKMSYHTMTPYGYLMWIFCTCLDWKEICGSERVYEYYNIVDSDKYRGFLWDNFRVLLVEELTADQLCDYLIQSFSEN